MYEADFSTTVNEVKGGKGNKELDSGHQHHKERESVCP
jgi:hypothetical protein